MDRKEMAAFLKAQRGRIDPQSAGFRPGRRRRVSGLRREEVAELVGISPDWYARLEQGRELGVSATVLERLAVALSLSPTEAAYLFSLAGLSAPKTATQDEKAVPELTSHRDLLESFGPNPAYYVSGPWNLAFCNRAAARMIPELLGPEGNGNVLRMIFCSSGFRKRLVNWADHAQRCIAVFRGDYGRNIDDARFRRLAAELTVASPEFAEWWPQQKVGTRSPTVKLLRDPELGELSFTLHFFHATEARNLILVVFAGDAEARERIASALEAADETAPV